MLLAFECEFEFTEQGSLSHAYTGLPFDGNHLTFSTVIFATGTRTC